MDCCVFVPAPKWLRRSSMSRIGYRPMANEVDDSENQVTVVVGKEKRVFFVDPFVLEEDPFRILIEMMRKKEKKKISLTENEDQRVIFVDVDAILFEHMLWLMYNDCSTLLQLNLKEIIEFYDQDY